MDSSVASQAEAQQPPLLTPQMRYLAAQPVFDLGILLYEEQARSPAQITRTFLLGRLRMYLQQRQILRLDSGVLLSRLKALKLQTASVEIEVRIDRSR